MVHGFGMVSSKSYVDMETFQDGRGKNLTDTETSTKY